MKQEVLEQFEGYAEVMQDIEVCRKYGPDYSIDRGSVERTVNLLHPARLKLRVSETIEETVSTKTLRLVSEQGYLPPFQAGQYIALFVEVGRVRTSRPYSISSPPNQAGYYDITVRRVENGLVSNYLLDEVKRGDVLESSGPAGEFYYNPLFHEDTMVCLAGGCGVTSFMSMVREVVECGLGRTMYVFHGNKGLEDFLFYERLRKMSERNENIHYIPVVEDAPAGYGGAQGLLTGERVKETLGDLGGKTYYVCGPQAMYDFCVPELERLGIARKRLRREMYGAPLEIWKDPGWPSEVKAEAVFRVEVQGRGSLEARASEPLLVALERQGIVVPSLCRSGECSMCRVKVVSGKVFQPAGALVRRSDRQFGYVHSCVSYPLEDLEILI
jgi:ferredoxin-NADP reductase